MVEVKPEMKGTVRVLFGIGGMVRLELGDGEDLQDCVEADDVASLGCCETAWETLVQMQAVVERVYTTSVSSRSLSWSLLGMLPGLARPFERRMGREVRPIAKVRKFAILKKDVRIHRWAEEYLRRNPTIT
jgi:hypothetical protein